LTTQTLIFRGLVKVVIEVKGNNINVRVGALMIAICR
jgi:hypothetical protein